MRTAPLAALAVAASSVTACAITTDEFARTEDGVIAVRAGQYLTRQELLEFEAPGAPEEMKPQLAEAFARGLTDGNTSCVTPEQIADRTGRAMLQSLTEGNCTVEALDVSGEQVTADMQCGGNLARIGRVNLAGRMSAESSDVVLTLDQEIDGIGPVHIKVRVTTQRTGECPLAAVSDGEGGADAKASAKRRAFIQEQATRS